MYSLARSADADADADAPAAAAEPDDAPGRCVATVVVPPAGGQCLHGLAAAFDEEAYDAALLEGVVSRERFARDVSDTNDVIASFWPCPLCRAVACGCCVCTLGFSCVCTYFGAADAARYARARLRHANRQFARDGVPARWALVRSAFASRIELRLYESDGVPGP